MKWTTIAYGSDRLYTRASEIPGVGVLVCVSDHGSAHGGVSMTTVYGARLRGAEIMREDRTAPPMRGGGLTAAEIIAKQPAIVDEGAGNYIVIDDEAPEY